MKKKKEVKKKGAKKRLAKDQDIAYDFSLKVYKRFKDIIKSIVLFGGVAKERLKKRSDIDLVIIIDDCTVQWDQELIAWYREELGKLINEQSYKDKLHINTVTLSVFWEEVRAGEPITINVLRYGRALIDFGGFFEPLKVLLAKGKIRPTPEAIFVTLKRAPMHVMKTRLNILNAVEGLYWGMVDSAHAALMAAGQLPPSPEHVADLLNFVFVKEKRLDKKYVQWYEEVRKLAHEITHGNIKGIDGKDVDDHIDKCNNFIKKMTDIVHNLIEHEKIIKIEKIEKS